ncbi:lipopolysaccharide assembly protein LapA domain-containing protein [Lacticigenium naphthae]|uniref:lipopolysaccharide assembly protein LapA domain-containing protein n=1 Tax=Lacticigenium naphthae TaxID=515351 RepID=UPI0003F768FA|nr:lipopolysaccharide assembly protein LapA domain-containing protein [Lacticigenium naphthae]
MKRQWSIVFSIVLILLVVVFAVVNVEPVPVNFGWAVLEWPLIIVIILSILIGAIIATLLGTTVIYKEKKHVKEAREELDLFKEEQQQEKDEIIREYEDTLREKDIEIESLQKETRSLSRELSNRKQITKSVDPES